MKAKVTFVISVCLALTGLSLQASPFTSTDCHPNVSEDKVHYIIGYGSLINTESKNRTYPDTGPNIPVKISGFKRTWTARGSSNTSLSTTYLGVDKDPGSSFNGVIYSVPNHIAVEKYDDRERYYCRVKVPYEDVRILKGNVSDNGTFPTENQLKNADFWIYATKPEFSKYPDETYPIVQSYVDIFLSGCIQMEKKYELSNYSDECVTTTQGWENPWVNDRVHPRRPWQFQAYAGFIDRLINRHIEDYHKNTYVEKVHFSRSVNAAGSQFDANKLKIIGYVLLAVSRLTL